MRYLLEEGNEGSTFSLLLDGRLYLIATPDKDLYQLKVRAIDGGAVPKFDTATVIVHVNETGCVPFELSTM